MCLNIWSIISGGFAVASKSPPRGLSLVLQDYQKAEPAICLHMPKIVQNQHNLIYLLDV